MIIPRFDGPSKSMCLLVCSYRGRVYNVAFFVSCEGDVETCWHSHLTYATAQRCWEMLHLWDAIEPQLV